MPHDPAPFVARGRLLHFPVGWRALGHCGISLYEDAILERVADENRAHGSQVDTSRSVEGPPEIIMKTRLSESKKGTAKLTLMSENGK